MTSDRKSDTETARPGIPGWGLILFLVSALALGGVVGKYGGALLFQDATPELERATWLPEGKQIKEFSLIDHEGRPFGSGDLAGNWNILFFGFTHCPDVCPTTLHSLAQLAKNVEDTGYLKDTRVLFVTVDPERDTPEQLGRYVPFFNPSFIGLTGDIEEINELTRDLGIYFIHGAPDEDGGYTVDHSAVILLISPDAELKALFSAPHNIDMLTRDYLAIRKAT